jgi:uncharacterized protein YkwD
MRYGLTILCLVLASPASAQQCAPTFGQRVVELFNQLRAENHLGPLTVNPQLIQAAQRHSHDMAVGRFLEHDGTDGSTVMSRTEQAGYVWTTVSENIAAGQATPDSVVVAWMRSPPHRANILEPGVKDVGIGYYLTDDEYSHYWTADFGATASRPDVIISGCHP